MQCLAKIARFDGGVWVRIHMAAIPPIDWQLAGQQLNKLNNMIPSASPLIPRIVLYLVAMIALAIPTAVNIHDARELAFLERTMQSTNGSIVGKSCSNHGKVRYAYIVAGERYEGSGTSCGFACNGAKIGQNVKIVYSEERPRLSRCFSVAESRTNVNSLFLVIGVCALVLAVIIWMATRVSQTPLDDQR